VGSLFESVICSEVDELEVEFIDGVCVWCKAMNEDSVLGGSRVFGRAVLMAVHIDILQDSGDARVAMSIVGW
jgi:hypothetical protein